ncbi:MAG: hypothetical protein M3405_03490 [Acidobacteriota bacterium]|nr:hypothetical protein [Acidobacteriota bacterium]
MKKVLFFIITAVFSVSIFAQTPPRNLDLPDYGIKIEPDKRLMLVLASLELADVNTPLTEDGEKFRRELQADLQKVSPELRRKIKIFVDQYRKRHSKDSDKDSDKDLDKELIAPFISMAYSLSAVPELNEPDRSLDLPDNLLEVLDYAVLVKEFYQSPGISDKINDYYKKYQLEGDKLRPSARIMVRQLTDYLKTRPQLSYVERVTVENSDNKKGKNKKNVQLRERERSFKIVPEMLAPKGTVNFLNVRDDYSAIVPPEVDLSSSDVRRGYLQFVLDPLVLNYAKEILTQSEGIKKLLAERREANAARISPDPFLAVSRSLVAAVDIREEEYRKTQFATQLARQKIDSIEKTETQKGEKDEEKRAIVAELNKFKENLADESALRLSESYEKGAVLAFYFAEKLMGTESSGFDISSSIKDWIVSLNPSEENKRLEQYADARRRAAERKTFGTENVITGNSLTAKLFKIDKLIEEKKYAVAEAELKRLLNENPTEIRIHYALGQVANLSAAELKDYKKTRERLELAIFHYNNAIRATIPITAKTSEADRMWVSLSYFALGRIYEFNDQNEYALGIYNAAIEVGDVEGGAFEKAKQAKERLEKVKQN